MKTKQLSTCLFTNEIEACKTFYTKYLGAKPVFDCGWYLSLEFEGGPDINFMVPQDESPVFSGAGVVLNFKVDDVDAEYERLVDQGIEILMPLDDHPWGDRGFSATDPIGTGVYIYSDREPSDEFKAYYID